MIKVNLVKSLPVSSLTNVTSIGEGADKIQLGTQEIQKQGAMRLLLILMCPAALYFYETQNIQELQAKIVTYQSQIAVLQQKNSNAKSAVDEISKYKEDRAKLQQQVDTLENLQKDRDREVKILDNIQKDIPEKVWLKRLEFKDTELRIFGTSMGDSEISNFVDSLSRIYSLMSVIPIRSADEVTEGSTFKSFELSCKVDRPSTQRSNQ